MSLYVKKRAADPSAIKTDSHSYLTSLLIGLLVTFSGVFAIYNQDVEAATQLIASTPSERGRIARGGRLYDNWATTLNRQLPESTHPLYPKTGKVTGSNSWRCTSCHGWDYRGVAGINRAGSAEYTGIIGIRRVRRVDTEKIINIIRDEKHQFGRNLLPDDAVADLALFIKNGQDSLDSLIQIQTLEAQGDPVDGAFFFHAICVRCHGADGRRINFSDNKKNPVYLGAIARRNPWKALHKIRNGQPGTITISFRTLLDATDQINILAFVQSLPNK